MLFAASLVRNQLFPELKISLRICSQRFFCLSGESRSIRVKQSMGKRAKTKASASTGGEKNPTPSRPLQKIPSSINLVVVGTGGPGTSRCLLLTTECSRYMFNCGEGSQRLTVMNKCLKSTAFAKISGLENIFITHKNWENTGGLLGIAMLVEGQKNPEIKNYLNRQKPRPLAEENPKAGVHLPELTLYGPNDVEKITLMARKFAERSNMNIVRKEGVFEDFAFKIKPVVVYNKEPHLSTDFKTTGAGVSHTDQGQTYAYICTANPLPPKINVEKCVDAGITMGPMVGELQRGNSVTLPDGTVVRPEQVTDIPESSKNCFLVVECPNLVQLPCFEASEELKEFRGNKKKESLAVVVHMTPAQVLNSREYQEWMVSFGEDTDHLIINSDASPADLGRVRNHQAQLNVVNPEVFPLLPQITWDKQENSFVSSRRGNSVVMKACSGLVYTLRGKSPGFHVETDEIDVETIQNELMEIPEVKTELDNLSSNGCTTSKSKEFLPNGECSYPKVVFLGTGSSEPNRIRSQSCIAVHLSEDSVMILDCGEDSYGQLFRFYGQNESQRVLVKLKAIFISHMHGDHHLGLLTLMKERRRAFEVLDLPFTPLILMAPIQMKRWLKFYHNEVEEVFPLFKFHKHQRELKDLDDQVMMNVASDEDIHSGLDFTQFKAVDVIHARNSFGITFTHGSGFKLVYSGDTRPCDQLVEAGENCDLLIHEATHEDDLLPHAKASKHSTFSEAMDVGKRMNAKHVILTHFSQRYSHMVPFFGMSIPSNVGVAFDNMQVTQESLPLLQSFISPLTQIFGEKIQKLEIKSLKRSREQAELEEL